MNSFKIRPIAQTIFSLHRLRNSRAAFPAKNARGIIGSAGIPIDLLRMNSRNGQNLAPFQAPRFEHFLPTAASHARSETMSAESFSLFRLPCTFGHSESPLRKLTCKAKLYLSCKLNVKLPDQGVEKDGGEDLNEKVFLIVAEELRCFAPLSMTILGRMELFNTLRMAEDFLRGFPIASRPGRAVIAAPKFNTLYALPNGSQSSARWMATPSDCSFFSICS
jgi:hypothetical protein